MESATILTHLALAKAVFCFPSEPNIPERPEKQVYFSGEKLRGLIVPNYMFCWLGLASHHKTILISLILCMMLLVKLA